MMKERRPPTARKPSVRSGPAACCAPRGSRAEEDSRHQSAPRLSNDSAAVLTVPGFPDPASPFQSSRTAPQPCPSPGRGMNAAPGRTVAVGSVIRRRTPRIRGGWGVKRERLRGASYGVAWRTERARRGREPQGERSAGTTRADVREVPPSGRERPRAFEVLCYHFSFFEEIHQSIRPSPVPTTLSNQIRSERTFTEPLSPALSSR